MHIYIFRVTYTRSNDVNDTDTVDVCSFNITRVPGLMERWYGECIVTEIKLISCINHMDAGAIKLLYKRDPELFKEISIQEEKPTIYVNMDKEIKDESIFDKPRLKSSEAALFLGCAAGTLRVSRIHGTLFGQKAPRYLKIGRKVLYETEHLKEWLGQFKVLDNTAQM